jgi:polyisoprenoid-binding protein YceI
MLKFAAKKFAPKFVFAAALFSAAFVAQAQQKLIPAQSEIVFISKQMGVPVDGKFTKFDVQSTFDPKKPEASKINFTVDLLSASIGAKETEAELKKPGWFDSLKLPNATFASNAVKALGGDRFEVAGKLSIKNIVRDVVVPVTLTQKDGVTRAEGGFVLKRLDFKIGDGEWNDTSLVANDVQVKLKLALTGVPPL